MGKLEDLTKCETQLVQCRRLIDMVDRIFEKLPMAALTRENWMDIKSEVEK